MFYDRNPPESRDVLQLGDCLQRSDGQVRQRIKSAYTPQSNRDTMHGLTGPFLVNKQTERAAENKKTVH